jgi:hypothetical protein
MSPPTEFSVAQRIIDGGEAIPALKTARGEAPPCYRAAGGQSIAYARAGAQSGPAPPESLSDLAPRGKNPTFGSLRANCRKKDFSLSVFEAARKKVSKEAPAAKECVSFGLCKPDGAWPVPGFCLPAAARRARRALSAPAGTVWPKPQQWMTPSTRRSFRATPYRSWKTASLSRAAGRSARRAPAGKGGALASRVKLLMERQSC